MPVLVACTCGKRLKVPDEFAGRNVRCPVCKAVMLATPSAAHTPPPAPISTISEADMVRFQCGICGKEMQALAQYGGQETVCPGCTAPVTIPARPNRAVQPAPPVLPPLPPAIEAEMPSSPRLRAKRPRRVGLWVALIACLLLVGGGFAAWLVLRETLPPDLCLVPPDAEAFVTLRAGTVWKSEAVRGYLNSLSDSQRDQLRGLEEKLGFTFDTCERFTTVIMDAQKDVVWFVIYTTEPYEQKKVVDAIVPGAGEVAYQNRKYHAVDQPDAKLAVYCHNDRVFVFGPKAGITACLDHLAARKTDGPLKPALKEAAGTHNLVAGFNPKSPFADTMRKELPAEMKKFEALLDATSVVLTGDITSSLQLELALNCKDSAAASEARNLAEGLKNLAIEHVAHLKKGSRFRHLPEPRRELINQLETALRVMTVEQKKETVLVQVQGELKPLAIAEGLRFSGTGADGSLAPPVAGASSVGNLRKIGKALLDYHERNGKFPAAQSVDPKNKPLLSWRVRLLSDLGEGELYRRFKLNEPWNSPHNLQLLAEMPAVYQLPNVATPPGKTFYKVFVGPNATFDGSKQPTMADIVDGKDKTIAVVEDSTAVEWTKPEDIPFSVGKGALKPEMLGPPGSRTFSVLFFNGAVKSYLHTEIKPGRLKGLITPAGHESAKP